jgi:hypothetical protein
MPRATRSWFVDVTFYVLCDYVEEGDDIPCTFQDLTLLNKRKEYYRK